MVIAGVNLRVYSQIREHFRHVVNALVEQQGILYYRVPIYVLGTVCTVCSQAVES